MRARRALAGSGNAHDVQRLGRGGENGMNMLCHGLGIRPLSRRLKLARDRECILEGT